VPAAPPVGTYTPPILASPFAAPPKAAPPPPPPPLPLNAYEEQRAARVALIEAERAALITARLEADPSLLPAAPKRPRVAAAPPPPREPSRHARAAPAAAG